MEYDIIVEYINQAYCSCIQFFINGRKAKRVESMVFDAIRQAKENGMQVLW